MTKFEDLPLEMQSRGIRAVREFMINGGYAYLGEAVKALNCSFQMVWDKIMSAAGLPECEAPEFIEVGPPVDTTLEVVWEGIRKLPRCLPVPKPGRSVEDDECGFVLIEIATVDHLETFLEAERIESSGWCTPSAVMALEFLVAWAEEENVGPDEGVLLALGVIQKH